MERERLRHFFLSQSKLPPAMPVRAAPVSNVATAPAAFHNPPSSIVNLPPPSTSGTRIDRDALVKQATAGRMWIQFAADAEWPHTVPANAPIRREFQLPANRAFIG